MRDELDADAARLGIGPQPKSDGPFRRDMRLHQSRYRHQLLNVPYGPWRANGACYGNMLAEDAAEKGLNFLTPEIFELAKKRIAEKRGGVQRFRLLRNMLSSQPMCFNLFGDLALDHDLGTVLLSALLRTPVERLCAVRFEHAPQPVSEYLNDRTAFDAFVEYESQDGLGFVGIETKLSEPFSPKEYYKPEYLRWMTGDGPWEPDDLKVYKQRKFNQLWRDHLLAWAVLHHKESKYDHGCLAVVHHGEDHACAKTIKEYCGHLRDHGTTTLRSFQLDQIVSTWRDLAPRWATRFTERYLSLPS